jgi:TolA-binding protein
MAKNITLTVSFVFCIFCFSNATVQADPADSLYAGAKTNEGLRKYGEAKAAYQQIIVQYSSSPVAENARLRLSRCNTLEFLAAENDAAAQLEIVAAEKNFANHPEWPWFLCRIATEYKRLEKHDQAKGLYEQVLRQYPGSPAAKNVRLELVKYKIESLVAAGEDAAVQSEIATVKIEFASHAELPGFLCRIANEYETLKKHDEAKGLYEQVVRQYPDSPAAKNARLELVRYEVLSLAVAGKDAEVQSEITKAKTEFAGRRELPGFLYSIANQYKKLKKPDQAKALYGQIIQQYPNKPVARGAQLQLLGYKIQSLAAAGKDAEVQSEIAKAKNELDCPAGDIIFLIGEDYYLKAEEAAKAGDTNQAKVDYQKALNLWKQFEQAIPDHSRPQYAYFSGIVCQRLGQYEQAMVYFQRVISKWPDYKQSWHARYMTVDCVEMLAKAGRMDTTQAKVIKQTLYQEIIQQNPDCPAAEIARKKVN